jgi:hypothetical protein
VAQFIKVGGMPLWSSMIDFIVLKFLIKNYPNQDIFGFVILIAVVIKSTVFWDITPYSPLKVNRTFGGKCRLHP